MSNTLEAFKLHSLYVEHRLMSVLMPSAPLSPVSISLRPPTAGELVEIVGCLTDGPFL